MSIEGEKILSEEFENLVKFDFDIYPQVNGKTIIENAIVRIDYLLRPKDHLIELGFDPVWFGIEIKHFGNEFELGPLSRYIWQCITYGQSRFYIGEESIRPQFILGYSDIDYYGSMPDCWNGLIILAGLAKVGMFYSYPSKTKIKSDWFIRFSTSHYFSKKNEVYRRHKYNIYKINTGNCAN